MTIESKKKEPAGNASSVATSMPGCIGGRGDQGSAILASPAFQKALLDAVPLPLFYKDTCGRYQLVNRTFAEHLRRSERDILGKTVFEIAPPELAAKYYDMDKALLEKPGTQIYEHNVKDLAGEEHEVIFHKATFADETGAVRGIVGVMLDITERKKAEEELRESHEELDRRVRERTDELLKVNASLEQEVAERTRAEKELSIFRELVNQSTDAIFIVDVATSQILQVNDAASLFLGYSRKEMLALRVIDFAVARTDHANWNVHVAELTEKRHMILEDRFRRKDGIEFPVEVSVKYFVHDDKPYIFAVVRDVSRRKEMESHIHITTEVLRLSSENITRQQYVEALGRLIKEWCECSTATIRMAGTGQTCGSSIVCSSFSGRCPDELHLEHMTLGQCTCFRALTGEPFPERLAVMTPGGSFFSDDTKQFLNLLGPDDMEHFHNFCLIRRYDSVAVIPIAYHKEVLGLIVFADDRKGAISRKTVEVLESLTTTIAEALCRHNVEEELKQSREQLRNLAAHIQEAREEERKNIAREIHDQLGQILTALKIDLSWMRQNCEGKEEVDAKAKSMISLVNQTILTVKKIVTELRPSVLDHLGIAAAIEWQAGEVQKLTGIRCRVELRPEKIILETGTATNLFRIFQEIMTNVIRHADATEVSILLENTNDGLLLRVADNGKGIAEKSISDPTSYGILGMRERVFFMGGTLGFSPALPHGTIVQIFVPAGAVKGIQ